MNGERLLGSWHRLRNAAHTAALRGSFAELGPRSTLVPPLRLGGARRIRIGQGTYLGAGAWIQALPDPEGADSDVAIHIGERCGNSGNATIIGVREVVIEDRVGMGRGIYIADHTHRMDGEGPVREQGITGIAPVRIRTGAWLGQGVVVLPGVTIGRGAVVGANAVVTHDVPDRCVAVGVPARVVKRLG